MCSPPGAVWQAPHYLIIVRAGLTQVFDALKQHLAQEPYPTTLIWDRRRGDRRVKSLGGGPGRRRSERRAPPDSIWETHGFVVAEMERPPLEGTDAYRNPAADAERGADLYRPARPESELPQRDRFGRLVGLKMFQLRLRAKVEESHRAHTVGGGG
jgi:hypothetical protein